MAQCSACRFLRIVRHSTADAVYLCKRPSAPPGVVLGYVTATGLKLPVPFDTCHIEESLSHDFATDIGAVAGRAAAPA